MSEIVDIDSLNIDKSNWVLTPIGDLADEISKRVDNPSDSDYEKFVGLEHFVSGDLKIRQWGSTENLTSSTKAFEAGDILLARRNAYLRRASLVSFDGVCSGDAFVLRENHQKVVPGFLAFVVNSRTLWEFANSNAAGTMSKRVKWRDLAEYEFLLPPKDQQFEIAELLWAQDNSLNSIVESLSKALIGQKAYWREVKVSTDTKKITEVAKVSNGTTPKTDAKEYWERGDVPWLPTGKVHEKFIYSSDTHVTRLAVDDKKSKIFPNGSTLVAMIGQGKTRGMAAQLMIDAAINQNFACVVPDELKIDSLFLFYALFFSYQRLRDISQGTNQLALNCELIKNFKIPYPSIHNQKKAAHTLLAFDQAIKQLNGHLENAKALQKSLINQIF